MYCHCDYCGCLWHVVLAVTVRCTVRCAICDRHILATRQRILSLELLCCILLRDGLPHVRISLTAFTMHPLCNVAAWTTQLCAVRPARLSTSSRRSQAASPCSSASACRFSAINSQASLLSSLRHNLLTNPVIRVSAQARAIACSAARLGRSIHHTPRPCLCPCLAGARRFLLTPVARWSR